MWFDVIRPLRSKPHAGEDGCNRECFNNNDCLVPLLRDIVSFELPTRGATCDRCGDLECSRCGDVHSGIPGYSFVAPWPWYTTPESERRTSVLTEDHCILLGEDYFIRGCIEIPVNGENDPFIWGVWVSLSHD